MGYGSSFGQQDYEKKSKLAHVKGVGSSGRGGVGWLNSKFIIIFSAPLALYILYGVFSGYAASYTDLYLWLSNPLSTTIMVLAIIMLFWHAMFGTLEVIDDYIHHVGMNIFLTMIAKGIYIFLGTLCLVSIFFIIK